MAQVKLLKIGSEGVATEFASTDDITLASYTVTTGGQVLSATGLAMNNTSITALQNITFQSPSTGTINQTGGNLIIDNIMAKERSNVITTAGDILFPVITDTAGQVDAFRLPNLAGPPTATPTNTGAGYLVYDSTNKNLYTWDGSSWDNLNTVTSAAFVDDPSYVATTGGVTAVDCVYITAAGTVGKSLASAIATARPIGFAVNTAVAAAAVTVRKLGSLPGFTALTPGAPYYLSPTTAGAVTTTIPAGTTGYAVVRVGYAKSATEMEINFEQLGIRS